MPSPNEIGRAASLALGTILVGCILILVLEVARQAELIESLTKNTLRLITWSAVIILCVYFASKTSLTQSTLVALVVFAAFSIAGYCVGVIQDIPALDDVRRKQHDQVLFAARSSF